jgi:signal peptidase I
VIRFAAWRSIGSLALQCAALIVLIAAFFIRLPQVAGLSMAPRIASGEFVLVDTLAYRFSSPRRGDIVAFRRSGTVIQTYIKRVIGLPGDRIRIVRGTVYVNGIALREPYVRHADTRSYPPIVVPPHELYVLGDNRPVSEDSRAFGCIPESDVIGKAIAAVWPPKRIGRL